MKIAITDAAAESLIGNASLQKTLRGESLKSTSSLTAKKVEGDVLIVNGHEDHEYSYAIIDLQELEKIQSSDWPDALARVHRVLRSASRGPIRLPTSWSEFHHDNLIAFLQSRKTKMRQVIGG